MYICKIKKHKGFILVEVIASILIFSIFAVFAISILSIFMKGYAKENKFENEEMYVSQGMTILDDLLKDGDEIKVQNNQIKIIKKDEIQYNQYKNIVFNRYAQRIMIDYYKYGSRDTSKPLIDQIKDFSVLQNKNVFYVFITCKDGRRYRRCFILKTLEHQGTA